MTDEDNLAGRVRRYARVGSAMAGLAARLAGERYFGIADRPRAPCRRSEGRARRHQGAADEGGPASRDDPRCAARGICPRADPASGQRAGDGLAVRPPPHDRRVGAGVAGPLPQLRACRRARRLARPGASRGGSRRDGPRLQIAVSRDGVGRRSRSAPAETGDGPLRALRPHGQHRRHPCRDRRPAARGTGL